MARLIFLAGLTAACRLSPLIANPAQATETNPPTVASDALASSQLARAENEAARIKVLVDQGTLSKSRLSAAEEEVADARDQLTLARTLYGQPHLQDMTTGQAAAMVEAAARRAQRQEKLVADRRNLLDSGILAKADFESSEQELASRKRVLELAQNRLKLLAELKQMAEAEQRLEQSARDATALNRVMVRYDGNGHFDLGDMTTISSEFERKFHSALPVSALGQTAVHQSMGLDHRNRVDVALNPDGTEGLWLRRLLERLRIPYLAFRSALAGAATAPHIHIGPGSTRLSAAERLRVEP